MGWLISGIMIVILFYGCYLLYKMYKEDLQERDKYIIKCLERINKLERCNMANEKLIEWLYDDLIHKNIIKIGEEYKPKKEN